jgi:putative MFS transporter
MRAPVTVADTADGGSGAGADPVVAGGFRAFVAVPLLATAGPVAVFGGAAVLIAVLCLDVGLLGPRSTGRALEEVSQAR